MPEFAPADHAHFKQWRKLLTDYTSDFERAMDWSEAAIKRDGAIPDVVAAYATMGPASPFAPYSGNLKTSPMRSLTSSTAPAKSLHSGTAC